MSREIIGKITCPLCGNHDATVHRQTGRRNAMYFRCYDGEQGDCGTIQCTLPGGQKFIRENMRALKAVEASEAANELAEVAREKQLKAANQPRKKSFLDRLLEE